LKVKLFILENEEENDTDNIVSRVTLPIEQCGQLRGVIKFLEFLFIRFQNVIKEIKTAFELEVRAGTPPPR
jgi:hypothetical protein